MPETTVKGPDGSNYTISHPEGASEADILAYAKNNFGKSQGPKLSEAVTDIPRETASTLAGAVQHLTGSSVSDLPGYDPRTRGQLGPVEGLMRTGRQIAALPEVPLSLIYGPAKSLIGHTMAWLEHQTGQAINPEIAARDDPQRMYQTAAGDVETALSAARPAGLPIKVAPKLPEVPAGAPQVTQAPTPFPQPAAGKFEIAPNKPAYQWEAPPAKPPPAPSVEELKDSASANYQSPEVKSLVLKPTSIRNFGNAAELALSNEGHSPEFATKTFQILRNLQRVPETSMITGDNLNTLRKMFRRASESSDSSERAAASTVIKYFDEAMTKIPQSEVVAGDLPAATGALENARGDWAAAARAENVDVKTETARARAAVANSGRNVANNIRSRMADIYLNPEAMSGYTDAEKELVKRIVYGTSTENILRMTGNLMGGGGGLGAAVTGGIGAVTTPGGIGGLIPVGGYALKSLSNVLTLRQANKLSELLRSRAPLASSASKFEEAAAGRDGTPATTAKLALAARNFTNNLRDAGFDVKPSDLFK
jgi:hypothetical protein